MRAIIVAAFALTVAAFALSTIGSSALAQDAAAGDVSIPSALRTAVVESGLLTPGQRRAWRAVAFSPHAPTTSQVCKLGRAATADLITPLVRLLEIGTAPGVPQRLVPAIAGQWTEMLETIAQAASSAGEAVGPESPLIDSFSFANEAANAAGALVALCEEREDETDIDADEVAGAYVAVLRAAIEGGLGRSALATAYATFLDLARGRSSQRAQRRTGLRRQAYAIFD